MNAQGRAWSAEVELQLESRASAAKADRVWGALLKSKVLYYFTVTILYSDHLGPRLYDT